MAWRHRRGRAQQEQPQLSSPQPDQVHTVQPRAHPGAHVPMAVVPGVPQNVPPPGTTPLAEPWPHVIDRALPQGGQAEVSHLVLQAGNTLTSSKPLEKSPRCPRSRSGSITAIPHRAGRCKPGCAAGRDLQGSAIAWHTHLCPMPPREGDPAHAQGTQGVHPLHLPACRAQQTQISLPLSSPRSCIAPAACSCAHAKPRAIFAPGTLVFAAVATLPLHPRHGDRGAEGAWPRGATSEPCTQSSPWPRLPPQRCRPQPHIHRGMLALTGVPQAGTRPRSAAGPGTPPQKEKSHFSSATQANASEMMLERERSQGRPPAPPQRGQVTALSQRHRVAFSSLSQLGTSCFQGSAHLNARPPHFHRRSSASTRGVEGGGERILLFPACKLWENATFLPGLGENSP